MRDNRDKWSFCKIPSRKELAPGEVLYWKNILGRILKVGMEFEFNLPEKKNGTCKGDNDTCPCVQLGMDSECWQECLNRETCTAISKSTESCENVTANCESGDCKDCSHYSAKCTGIYCPNFVSSCYTCQKFTVHCKSCEYHFDPNKSPDAIRKALQGEFKPTNSYGVLNQSCVHSITTDGSLLGKKGAEIITVGRRVDYWEFYKMAKNIIDLATARGAYLNERCSIHMHVLASYYGNIVPPQEMKVTELERDMPEIILANLHQLVRRYQNAMTWMTMGLDNPKHMTRWEKFRVSVLPVTAIMTHMANVQQEVSRIAGGNKYGWINYNPIEFSSDGDIRRFHVEFRAADGMIAPSAVAAIACMYYALVIKAVEISRYGVAEVGDKEWFSQAQHVKEALLNNMKGYQDGDRFGDTSTLPKYYDILIGESLDLVRQLKAILINIGPAFDVLEKLAERPIALRRCDGESWWKIEEDLKVLLNEEGQLDLALTEIITLNQVSDCKDVDEWIDAVAGILRTSDSLQLSEDTAVEDVVRNFFTQNKEDGKLIWSSKIGGPIMI